MGRGMPQVRGNAGDSIHHNVCEGHFKCGVKIHTILYGVARPSVYVGAAYADRCNVSLPDRDRNPVCRNGKSVQVEDIHSCSLGAASTKVWASST